MHPDRVKVWACLPTVPAPKHLRIALDIIFEDHVVSLLGVHGKVSQIISESSKTGEGR